MRRAVYLVIGVAVLFAVFFGVQAFIIGGSANQLQDDYQASRTVGCEDAKERACKQEGQVGKEDYPDNCFTENGHILAQPYVCN